MEGFKKMKAHTNEKLTWLNYWTPEMWALRDAPEVMRIDITKYVDNLIELGYDGKTDERALISLRADISTCFKDFRGKFIRLNRRSPKDFTDGRPINNVEECIEALTHSMRVMDDLSYLKMTNEPAFLYFYHYNREIQEKEFRAFVKDSQVIAISQYEGTKIRGYPESCVNDVSSSILGLGHDVMLATPLKNFIYDVYMTSGEDGETANFLEINPWGMSDPCFFKSYGNVEKGGFAYQKTEIIAL